MKYYSNSQRFPICLSLLIFLIASCSEAQVPFSFKLPNKLKEVSGLAHSPDGRVFALNDEKGIVYEIDMKGGGIVPVIKIQKANGKTLRADFEGLAFLNDEFYLVTSKGMLYRSTWLENKPEEQTSVDTGLSEICEVEGLSAYDDILYLVCKTNYREKDKGFLLIYEHNPKSRKTELYLRVATERLNRRKLNPSGIAVTENEIFVVSAIQGILTRLDRKGNFIRDLELDTKRHRQTEGILVLDSGTIILADEGKRKHGRVTVYEAK